MTTKTDITQERAAFEAWMHSRNLGFLRDGDSYSLTYSRRAWEAWQARAAVEADRARRGEATAADAMAILRAALSADPDYAWGWHCAVWAAAHDEGLETGAANRAAARFMHAAFDVDTTKSPNFNPEHLVAEKERQ